MGLLLPTASFPFFLCICSASPNAPVFQKGMSYVSWPPRFDSADSDESLYRLKLTGTEWVAINVFWYQDTIYSTEIHPAYNTPSNSSVIHAIERAHNLSMKVMLKPMVDPLDGHWRGEIPPSDDWFQSYANFINFWAGFAEEHGVEMLCVGCEFNSNDVSTSNWEVIVAGVRQRYSGPITYAANWDHYKKVMWWSSLDYVGIDAYFPLTSEDDPTLDELKAAWNQHANTIGAWQATIKKPIIFTEIGYRSADGANKAPWDYSTSLPVDLQEQVDCYEAAFQILWNRTWFYGFYWWNWETKPYAGGVNDAGFTPQNKPAENTTRAWYSAPSVDGIAAPVDKLALLLPYIVLASSVLAATVTALVYVKRVRHTKHKQLPSE
jgi:hypothetical protein